MICVICVLKLSPFIVRCGVIGSLLVMSQLVGVSRANYSKFIFNNASKIMLSVQREPSHLLLYSCESNCFPK